MTLQKVADGEITRCMIFMPPRHGKSETASRLLPGYFLLRNPQSWVGLTAYAGDHALNLSRNAQDYYRLAGGPLNPRKRGAEQWETGRGGGMWAAGARGPATGKGFMLGIVDDPIKDHIEASSKTTRESTKDWWRSVFSTRANMDGNRILVIQTRWHEDDLSGWLLQTERECEEEEQERWHVINMPAIKEEKLISIPASCTLEPDERPVGAVLCPEIMSLARLKKQKKQSGEYYFGAMYQQNPRPKEGNFFKEEWFKTIGARPVGITAMMRAWDLGATQDGGDYTVGALVALLTDGRFAVLDLVRGQWSPGARDEVIYETAKQDGLSVMIAFHQEPGAGGKSLSHALVKLLAGFSVFVEPETTNKELRAQPFASQMEAKNVVFVNGCDAALQKKQPGAIQTRENYRLLKEEMMSFPMGHYDDQVDAVCLAFNLLARHVVIKMY